MSDFEHELAVLAQELTQVAVSADDRVISRRLAEMAEEVLGLAEGERPDSPVYHSAIFSCIRGVPTSPVTRMQMTVPLAQRSATELQAKAAELLRMSNTARTGDTRDALRRLASRFALLAESRVADQAGRCSQTGSWTLLRPSDTPGTNR